MDDNYSTPSMSSIAIDGLFGYLQHGITLDKEHVVFIHGPNGCGKTTVLNIISAVFKLNFKLLFDIDFKRIEIKFDDQSTLEFIKKTQNKTAQFFFGADDDINGRVVQEMHKPEILLVINFNGTQQYSSIAKGVGRPSTQSVSEIYPFLRRISPRAWRDLRTGQKLTYDEIIEKFVFPLEDIDFSNPPPSWFINYIKSLNVQFIKTQRLSQSDILQTSTYDEDDEEYVASSPIMLCSNEIRKMILQKRRSQSDISQASDSTFPERLLRIQDIQVPEEENVRDSFEANEKRIQELVGAGLMAEQRAIKLPGTKLTPTQLQVIDLYLNDMNEKLKIFDELYKKIKTFLNIITQKFKNKKITINREEGIQVYSKNSTEPLPLDSLSSGEQHQIVLFFELIFNTSRNSLFLIDEPEISLHADWQRSFVDDLENVKELGYCQFLIATHSPQIIGKHLDWAQALDGGVL